MLGKLRKIEKKEFKTKENKKFTKILFECDLKINDKGDIKTLRGSYSEDFAKKYFAYCNVKTKDLIGKEVECITAKRTYINADGVERTINYIKFMNVLDSEGKPIIMHNDDSEELDF